MVSVLSVSLLKGLRKTKFIAQSYLDKLNGPPLAHDASRVEQATLRLRICCMQTAFNITTTVHRCVVFRGCLWTGCGQRAVYTTREHGRLEDRAVMEPVALLDTLSLSLSLSLSLFCG